MSTRADSPLKQLVKEARARMAQNAYATKTPVVEVYAPYPTVKADEEERRIYDLICEMESEDGFVTNPIGRLIDKDIFSKMSDLDQQRYVLNLSSLYRKLLQRYKNVVGK